MEIDRHISKQKAGTVIMGTLIVDIRLRTMLVLDLDTVHGLVSTKFDFAVDEGKTLLDPSRDKKIRLAPPKGAEVL